MIKKIILLITFTIGLSSQYGQKPQYQPQPEWPPQPAPEWRPPAPEWRPPAPEWRPPAPEWQPNPKPENCCKVVPKKAYNVEFTPIVKPEVTSDSVYPCAEGSVIRQIEYHTVGEDTITCNGVVVYKNDDTYEVVFNAPSYGGGKHKDVINLVNYTQIYTYNNGNTDYIECAIILGGRCSGDTLWGTGIYQANDQNGCSKSGITSVSAIYRQIEVRGKCASKCSLGLSVRQFEPPVNNQGLTDRLAILVDNKANEE